MEQAARRRFDVREYYRMAETGILKPDERVELIDGDILVMSPAGSSHASMVDRLFRLLTRMLDGNALVRSQNPIRLDDTSEPEPDISVARPRDDEYSLSHPVPSDLLLVIEVADSSETPDRQTKRPVYARAGIPEFWLVSLSRSVIEIYRNPTDGEYMDQSIARKGDVIALSLMPDVQIDTARIFI